MSFAASGADTTLVAVALDDDGQPISGLTFSWSSSDEAVATVTDQGVVTAVGSGIARITASASGVTSPPAMISVRLPVVEIELDPPALSLTAIGLSQALQASAMDAAGAVVPVVAFSWASSDTSVVTVTTSGQVTAVGTGAAAVTAAVDGQISNAVAVTVRQVVTSVVVDPPSLTFTALGQSTALTATALDAGGTPVPGTAFTWNSSDPLVANVSTMGWVTAVGPGLASVTAGGGGGVVSDSVVVRVAPIQIVLDQVSTATAVSTSNMTWLHTIGGGANRYLVVGVGAEAASSRDVDVSQVTFNGIKLKRRVDEDVTSGFTSRAEIWTLDEINLPQAGTYSVLVTFNGTVAEAAAGAMSFENVEQSAPEAKAKSKVLGQLGISTNIATLTPLAWVVDVVHAGDAGNFTPGPSQTERFDVGMSSTRVAASTREIVTPATVTVTQTHSTVANRLVHTAIVITPQ